MTLHTGQQLKTPEEVEHRGIDCLRPLLLGPVTAAREHERPPEAGDELRQIGNELVHPAEGDHQVPVPGDVECRYVYARPGKGREKFPVAVNITIPVQPPTKPSTREFPHEELEVGLSKPWR